ncbi:unnamed protein product [Fraxinus pennsylvanica]|uniref:Retrotransposon gag domain-containing protein n=1 Tax=Fraxinus pennsylvanica TaxID=56036 RepID=A0AAD2DQM0_9LAMI|nr:unnamed protein product [Fraxinus pennsylvanica]
MDTHLTLEQLTVRQPGGFMADARAWDTLEVYDNGGSEASSVLPVASASRLVTMDSCELAKIIPMESLLDSKRTPKMKEYNGTTDPINHLNMYTDVMNLNMAPDPVICKAFLQTMTNAARDWFSTLEPNSIASFSDLADKFSTFFASSKRIKNYRISHAA